MHFTVPHRLGCSFWHFGV